MIFLLVIPAIIVGAISQRVTGMGFGMIVSPFLILLLDPLTAVLIVNLCGGTSSVLIGMRMRDSIDWRRYAWLAGAALLGIIPGTLLLISLPRAVLETIIGSLLILALTASMLVHRTRTEIDGLAPRTLSGFGSGLMTAAAGVGGPLLTVYAVVSRWPQKSFAATVQPYLVTVTGAALISKFVLAGEAWPDFELWIWLAIIGSLLTGLVLGDALARYVSAPIARRFIVVIAYGGAALTMFKGVAALLGA